MNRTPIPTIDHPDGPSAGPLPISVLDVCPIWSDGSSPQSLASAVETAQAVERLGLRRYWVAEHHVSPSMATAAPAVLAATIAARTQRIRVGSGGVLLSNHAPIVVAEQFGTLEALHPGRIDLGVGRAPGTTKSVAQRFRRSPEFGPDDFAADLGELMGAFASDPGRDAVVPASGNRPDVWLLGSSTTSALLAGRMGLPYAFAHHINPDAASDAVAIYRRAFAAAGHARDPAVIMALRITVADDSATALRHALPSVIGQLRSRTGATAVPFPAPSDVPDEMPRTAAEAAFVRSQLAGQMIGSPDDVACQLRELLTVAPADELMALTLVHDPAARLRSYELLVDAVNELPRRAARR